MNAMETGKMSQGNEPARRHRAPNLALILVVGLPAAAVVGSLTATAIAFAHRDPELPGQYHWEGLRLDHDFATADQAVRLGVQAQLKIQPASGLCRVELQLAGRQPAALSLSLVHGTRPELDRNLLLHPAGAAYVAPCGKLANALWHLELADDAHTWSVRQDVSGSPSEVNLSARRSGG